MKRVLIVCAAALLMPGLAVAQESVSGIYANFNLVQTDVKTAEGTIMRHTTVDQYSTTSTPDSPFNNVKLKCHGLEVLSEAGASVASAGTCIGSNPAGDVFWEWWRTTESGTEACPVECGVWAIYHGTGAFEGMTGEGTWKVTAVYPDQTGAGVWDLK
jgi:hypothetical protein